MRGSDLAVVIMDEHGKPVNASIHEDYMVLYTTLRVTKSHRAGDRWLPDMGTLTFVVADPKTVDPITPMPV
jgi:hypothetical protein